MEARRTRERRKRWRCGRAWLLAAGAMFLCGGARAADRYPAHESRFVGDFDAVEVDGALFVLLTQGPKSVEVVAQDGVVSTVGTTVQAGRLRVFFSREIPRGFSREVRVFVQAPALRSIGATQGAQVDADLRPGSALALAASGAHIWARGVKADAVSVRAAQQAQVKLSGEAGEGAFILASGAQVEAKELLLRKARIDAGGGAQAALRVAVRVSGLLTGESELNLYGGAAQDLQRSADSSLRLHPEKPAAGASP